MRKSVLLFLFCCIALIIRAADVPKYFTVWLKNGQRIDLLLSEKPNVQYSEGILKFKASDTDIEYNVSEVKEFTLESTASSGIKSLSADGKGCVIAQLGNILSISGAEPYAKIHLYATGGMLISTQVADGKGSVSIPLNQLTHGVYILKLATTTFKIMRK